MTVEIDDLPNGQVIKPASGSISMESCIIGAIDPKAGYFTEITVGDGLVDIVGAYTLALTLTAATALTLPTAGTVVSHSKTKAFTRQQYFETVAITSTSASVAWDLDLAQNAIHVLTEHTTLANPTNMKDGAIYTLTTVQHGSSAKTFALGSAYRPVARLPLISTVLGAVDEWIFKSNGSSMRLIGYSQNVGT
jgi:hypothetical protein